MHMLYSTRIETTTLAYHVHVQSVHVRWVGRVPMGQKSFLTHHP